MKKVISLLLATIMMFSFAVISHADENINVTISSATVAQNATGDDAKATVTYTIGLPTATALFGVKAEITYNKSALTLNSYTCTNTGITAGGTASNWDTAYTNADVAYGISLDFNAENADTPTTALTEYVITLNFTVNDTATVADYELGLQSLQLVDDGFSNVENTYPVSATTPGKITVKGAEEPKTNVVIEAPEVETSTDTYADGSYNAGFLTSFTVDGTKNNPVSGVTFAINNGSETKTKAVSLGTTVTSGTVKVALNILKVKSGVTLEAVSVTPVAPAAN